jgi:hypothetical protein
MSSLPKRALKLITRSFILLRAQSNKTINLFSKRDFIVITFFTILGMGGVFAASLVTLTPSDSQGAGYLAATACDADGVTIDKSVVFNSTTKRYTVTTISISGVDQRYDANGINGCGGKTLELAIPVNGVTTYATWNIPPSTLTSNSFTISSGTYCSRYGTNSATISVDSTLLDKLALTVTGLSTNSAIELDSNLLVKYTLDESNSFSGSGNTVYDLAGTAENGQIRNSSNTQITSSASTDSTGNKYLDISSTQYVWSSAVTSPTSQSIMLWVYLTNNGVIYDELGGGQNPNSSWHDSQIEMVSNTLKFRVWNSANPILTVNTDYSNGWHLIGYTISPKTSGQNRTLTAYVDGVNVGSNTQLIWEQPSSVSHSIGSTETTHLGDGTAGDFRFNSFYLYGKALTSTEVLNLYTLTKGCKR